MAESNANKRQAQSPLSGDEDDLNRRIIDDEAPVLLSLDEISDNEEKGAEEELLSLVNKDGNKDDESNKSTAEKVEFLIGRIDRFMDCFATLQSSVNKNQRSNDKKFKQLEGAHNELATKVASSTISNRMRIEALEAQLKDSLSKNTRLENRITQLEGAQEDQRLRNKKQRKINNDLEMEQGYINKNLYDHGSEIKERKMIISGVLESPGEVVSTVALNCIHKIIDAAIASKQPNSTQLGGLRKLNRNSIDNVFRIGKHGRRRNISVTFVKFDDKEMVFKAKMDTKEEDGIKFFLNEDAFVDGRTLKANLKRIVSVAKSLGKNAKLAGNKVFLDGRVYSSYELALLPPEVLEELKQEKMIDDGIVYRGERSFLSNFYPARLNIEGTEFAHVEKFYQFMKATHHGDTQTAARIMALSNPRRIKSIGDNIEGNSEWSARRMVVLYDGQV